MSERKAKLNRKQAKTTDKAALVNDPTLAEVLMLADTKPAVLYHHKIFNKLYIIQRVPADKEKELLEKFGGN